MFGFIQKLFASVGVIVASVFSFNSEPIKTPTPTFTPTPIVEEVEKLPEPTPKIIYITVTPKPTIQIASPTPIPTSTPTPVIFYTPAPIKTWAEVEKEEFAKADRMGWVSIQTVYQGETRYYDKEGGKWVRKNSEAESSQPYVASTPVPTPDQDAAYRQYLTTQINNLIQQRYQQLLVQQQEQQKYNDQLNSLVQQINQIKADYYEEVENIENQTVAMTFINAQISKLTQDTNKKINQLTSQYNLLLSQQGAPLNYQVSQNLTLPNTSTVWRIDGSLNGMDGTITGSNGQQYRWDCVDSTSCTLY